MRRLLEPRDASHVGNDRLLALVFAHGRDVHRPHRELDLRWVEIRKVRRQCDVEEHVRRVGHGGPLCVLTGVGRGTGAATAPTLAVGDQLSSGCGALGAAEQRSRLRVRPDRVIRGLLRMKHLDSAMIVALQHLEPNLLRIARRRSRVGTLVVPNVVLPPLASREAEVREASIEGDATIVAHLHVVRLVVRQKLVRRHVGRRPLDPQRRCRCADLDPQLAGPIRGGGVGRELSAILIDATTRTGHALALWIVEHDDVLLVGLVVGHWMAFAGAARAFPCRLGREGAVVRWIRPRRIGGRLAPRRALLQERRLGSPSGRGNPQHVTRVENIG